MSTEAILSVACALIGLVLGYSLRVFEVYFKGREASQMKRQADEEIEFDHSAVEVTAEEPMNVYEIRLADWGPAFTGALDTLHRWRWTVWTNVPGSQDLPVHSFLGGDMPIMLGNEPTSDEAIRVASEWIESQGRHPYTSTLVEVTSSW